MAERYLVQRLLGRGGAKEVWLAHDLALDRPVALARVHGGGDARERLRREARLTARLGGHRHIVTVHDVFEHDGAPWLVARYMSGGSLADRLARAPGGRLALDEALRIAREVADALAHAHAHGIVHRDVKPDNVWLDAEGEAALGDFGVASAPELGAPEAAPVGTPLYMAPEQAAGGPAHAAQRRVRARRDAARAAGRRCAARRCPPTRRPRSPTCSRACSPPTRSAGRRDAAAAREALDALAGGAGRAEPPEAARLVGRAAELERLREALARAWSGTASTVIVEGEAGIGKTALLDALAAEARVAGGIVVWGRGEPDGVAYGPWRPVVRALGRRPIPASAAPVGRLRGGGRSGGGRRRTPGWRCSTAVADLVGAVAARSPGATVLDDLHWADASSVRLLAHVVGRARDAPCCWSAAFSPASRRIAGRPARRPAVSGRAGARRAVRGCCPTPRRRPRRRGPRAHRRQPVLRVELSRLLEAEGRRGRDPLRVREVVRAAARRLGPETERVLQAAAVAGRFTWPASCAWRAPRATARPRDRAGVTARLMSGVGRARPLTVRPRDRPRRASRGAARRRHAGSCTRPWRTALDARRDAGTDVTDAELARHTLAAARAGGGPAGRPGRRRGRRARPRRRSATPRRPCTTGGARGAGARRRGPRRRAARRRARAGRRDVRRRRHRGRPPPLRPGRRRRPGAPARAELLARAALGFAQVSAVRRRRRGASRLLSEALEALPPGDDPLRARAAGLLAAPLEPAHEQERREALIDEALAMARRLGDEATLGWLQSFAVMVDWRPERADRRRAAAEAVVRATGEHGTMLWAHVQRSATRCRRATSRPRTRSSTAPGRWPPACGARTTAGTCWSSRPRRAAFAGRLADAERLGEEALELNRRHGEDCEQEYTVQRLVLARLAWRPHESTRRCCAATRARYRRCRCGRRCSRSPSGTSAGREAARRGARRVRATSRPSCARPTTSPRWPAWARRPPARATLEQVRAPVRAARAARRREPGASTRRGRACGPVARGRSGCWRRPTTGRATPPAHFADALRAGRRWGAPAWALRAIGDWLATGVPVPDRAALAAEGLALARELGLPRAAARIADEAQITTP